MPNTIKVPLKLNLYEYVRRILIKTLTLQIRYYTDLSLYNIRKKNFKLINLLCTSKERWKKESGTRILSYLVLERKNIFCVVTMKTIVELN